MAKAARQDGGQAGREEGQPRPGPVSGLGVATAGPEPPRESTLRFPRLGESSSGAGRRWLLLLGTSRPLPPPAGTGRCVLGEWLGTAGGRSVPSEERRLPMGPRAPGVGVSCRLPGRGRPGAGCWSLFFLWVKRLDCLRIRVGGRGWRARSPWEEPSSWAGGTEDGSLGWRTGPRVTRGKKQHWGPMLGELRPRLEAEAVWLCSPGQEATLPRVWGRKRRGLGTLLRADRALGWLHSYSGPHTPSRRS